MRYLLIALCSIVFTIHTHGQTTAGSKKIKIKKGQTYLNFPVDPSAQTVKATVLLDGKPIELIDIKLANGTLQFWSFFDISAYAGKTLTVEVGGNNAAALEKIYADATFPGKENIYKEKDRPQAHFTTQIGWINDPNGLVYHDGEYHLYFQHNPYGWQWGNMHWGHAVSTDLIHWKQLPEAIYPVIKEGVKDDAAFSGSATVDPKNTSGFRKNGIDPIIAAYTSTGRGECLKLSYDKGRTFEEYEGNPILKHEREGRDPKLLWYEPGNHWVLVVWDATMPKKMSMGQQAILREHSIYTSPDLKTWTYRSGVAGFFECPDLFELPVEGTPGVKKWVMYDASGKYVVGDFNGKEFKIEQHFTPYEHGGAYFYASQTYNNAPDGRKIQVGWGRDINYPGMPFNQVMLFPSELKLKKTVQGYRLCPSPIAGIKTLHKNSQVVENRVVTPGQSVSLTVNPDAPLHIVAAIERGDAHVAFNMLGYEIRYDNEWIFSTAAPKGTKGRNNQPNVIYTPGSDVIKIEAILDKNLLEFFINDGELYYVTEFDMEKKGKVEALVPGDGKQKFIVKKLEVHELNSIWTGQ